MRKILAFLVGICSSYAGDYYYQNGEKVVLDSVKNRALGDMKLYRDSINRELGLKNELLVKFSNSDINLTKILLDYNLTLKEKIEDIYLFESQNPIISANALYEANITKFAHPNFAVKIKNRSFSTNEPYAKDYAYHLFDTPTLSGANINLSDSWLYSRGEGIKVAVFDSGVDVNHKDLSILSSYSTLDGSTNVSSTEPHGTFIAGLIGARENLIGSVGVAPNSSLIAIKMNTDYSLGDFWSFTSNLIKGFKYAKTHNVDIINCSWGTYNRQDGVVDAIQDLIKNGRSGKGTLVFFGIGNAGCNEKELCDEDYDGVPEGYLFQDESTIDGVITIGATGYDIDKTFYSNYGTYLHFMAFGGDYTYPIFSTDISGKGGYDNFSDLDYGTSIGTSFSTPIVAGVSALMLGTNPNLTKDDVFEILKLNTKKVGNYRYYAGKSYDMGYGLIDAYSSVEFSYILSKLKNSTFNINYYFWADSDKAYLSTNPSKPAIWEFTPERKWKPLHNAGDFDGYPAKGKIFNNVTFSNDLKTITFSSSTDNNSLSNRSFNIGWYLFSTDFGTFIATNRDSQISIWQFTDERKWKPIHSAVAIDGYYHNAKKFFNSVYISSDGKTITFK